MWRVLAPALWTVVGCNTLLGIHELDVDAGRDVGGPPSDGPPDAASPCAIATSLGSPDFQDQAAFVTPPTGSDSITVVTWQGSVGSGADQLVLELEVSSGGGSAGSPDWPASLAPKSGIQFADAPDAYAFILAGLGSNSQPTAVYLTSAGTLDLTQAGSAVGDTFAGSMLNVDFVHVDVDLSTGEITGNDPDNCITLLTSAAFSATVMASSAFAPSPASRVR